MFNKTFITGLLIINLGAYVIAVSTDQLFIGLLGGVLTLSGGFLTGYSADKQEREAKK